MENISDIGKRIKELRKRLGLNQADFAGQLGLDSPVTISRYETGEREIPNTILVKISKLVNVSLDWLLTGEGEMERGKNILVEKPQYRDPRLSDLYQKLESIYNEGSFDIRAKVRGIIEEAYDETKKKETLPKEEVVEMKKTA